MATGLTHLRRLCFVAETQFALGSRLRSSLFLLALLGPSFAIAVKSVKIATALALADSTNPLAFQRAVVLDPDNDEIQDRVGNVTFFWATQPNQIRGLEHLRRATQLNPYCAVCLAHLALACESTRDYTCVQRGFERALALTPMSPSIHWVAANAYLRIGRVDDALAQFRTLLELVSRIRPSSAGSEYIQSTFRLCLRVVDNPQAIAERVLPAGSDPALELQFVSFLSTHGQLEQAYPVWARVVAHRSRFPFSLAQPYLDQLMKAGDYEKAKAVWWDLQGLGIVGQPQTRDGDELIFNGGFEQAPLDSGFDWRSWEDLYPSVEFSDSTAHQGARCLRIDFTVKHNDSYEPVFQSVPVVPGQSYALSAYVRSKDITSDSGPRLRVLDPNHPEALDQSTDGTVGTTGWHRLSIAFSTGAETRLVRISVWRPRSRSFPFEISGTFWLDDVSLKLAPQASKGGSVDPGSNARRSIS